MTKIEVIRLMWGGRETAASAIEALQRHANVEITLPSNLNHALFRRFHPDAAAPEAEQVDVSGGAELIPTLAALAGLEALEGLAEPLARSGYRLRLRSPVLSLIPPGMA